MSHYFKNARRDLSEATKLRGILPDPFLDELEFKRAAIGKGRREQRKKMRALFVEFLKLVIDDCIQRNVRFYSPTRNRVEVYITEKTDKEIFTKFKRGLYGDVDLIKSDAKVYQLYFFSHFIGPRPFRKCRMGYTKYKEVMAKVNKGMRYYERNQKAPLDKITRMVDYIDRLQEVFPQVDERTMRKIIIRGFQRIHREMNLNRDVFIKSAGQGFQLIIDKAHEKKVEEHV